MFKDKSTYYELYRPNYPHSIVIFLKEKKLLMNDDLVAEVGSGTGKLTTLILKQGNQVYGVEKDKGMQDFLEKRFQGNKNFTLVKKTAENTGLPAKKFDLLVAAQSFHLFNPIESKEEFYRIVKNNGKMVFIWYHWDTKQEVCQKIQKLFYTFGERQQQKERTRIGLDFFNKLFYPNTIEHSVVDTIKQKLSKEEFINSMLSSSYATTTNNNLHIEYLREIEDIFNCCEKFGYIEYSFTLEVYFLKL